MHPNAKIKLSSAATDAIGRSGTKENCMLELEKKNPDLMHAIIYALCYLLHAHNLLSQQSWGKHFGEFGIDKNTMSQCVCNCMHLFKLPSKSLKLLCLKITNEYWNDLKLFKVISTR